MQLIISYIDYITVATIVKRLNDKRKKSGKQAK